MEFEARRVIEALRSGVSSRAVGQYFSAARQGLMHDLQKRLHDTCEKRVPNGMVITGKYGEGKTHLLNTVFTMAHAQNMVVSFISLSKETPFNQMPLVYSKILANTYLPKRLQPGFTEMLLNTTLNSQLSTEMQAFTAKRLEADKLFYLLRAYFATDDMDEKYMLQADLEGDFVTNAKLKQIYKRIFNEKVAYNTNFLKTKHMGSYFATVSRLFLEMGYAGWVILFDEAELIGRLGKKARLNAYKNMADFLFPGSAPEAVCTVFAFTSSFAEDVIEARHEFDNTEAADFTPGEKERIKKVLHAILAAEQLQPLTKAEIETVMFTLLDFYTRAYDWHPQLDMHAIIKQTEHRGYLLRTRIRAAVECLDQLYQYNQLADIRINNLGQVSYEEDIPSLEEAYKKSQPNRDEARY